MQTGAITSYMDVAQLTLYAFWLFFAGLIFYLLRENKREGYPLVAPDRAGISPVVVQGFPPVPAPKAFRMPDGSDLMVPRGDEHREPLRRFTRAGKFQGAPIEPTGERLTAGIGPGAWANRDDVPDLTFDDGKPRIAPLRAAPDYFLATEDPTIIGYTVIGADKEAAGTVAEAWIDRSEVVVRYLEIELTGGGDRVLLPMTFLRIDNKGKRIICRYVKAAQFALAPRPASPDQVTLLEEDQIQSFYSGGSLYAWPGREGPLL